MIDHNEIAAPEIVRTVRDKPRSVRTPDGRYETVWSQRVTVSFRNGGRVVKPDPTDYPRRESNWHTRWVRMKLAAAMVCECQWCASLFGCRAPAKWCSPRCSNLAAAARRQVRRGKLAIVCPCGETVEQSPAGRLRRHCSPACRQRAYRSRVKPQEVES